MLDLSSQVTGWGQDAFGGELQARLQEVILGLPELASFWNSAKIMIISNAFLCGNRLMYL